MKHLHTRLAPWLTLASWACGSSPDSSADAAPFPFVLDSGAVDAAPAVDGSTDAGPSPSPELDSGPGLAEAGPGADASAGGPSADAAQEAAADAALEAGEDAAGDGSASDAGQACTACTGPGDWGPGDYPPDLLAHDYLTLKGVSGQGDAVRGYKVHVPPSYDPETPMPLLFAIHGLGQNPLMYAVDGAGWPDKADEEGFLLVMPNGNAQNADGSWGITGSWNAGECCGGAALGGLDDVALIRAIADEVGTHLNVDLTRVYATGLSNGGFLSYRLACEASDLFVAIAPGAGAIGTPTLAPMGTGNADFTECNPSKPVAVLALHGTNDPLVPYAYFEPSLAHFAQANGCADTPEPAIVPAGGGDTECITYPDCHGGFEVSGCTVRQGGHCWFGNASCGTGDPTGIGVAIVGANSDTLVATDAAWSFLSRIRRAP